MPDKVELIRQSAEETIAKYISVYGMRPRCLYFGPSEYAAYRSALQADASDIIQFEGITILPMTTAGIMARLE